MHDARITVPPAPRPAPGVYVGGRTACDLLAVVSAVVGAALASAPPPGAELTAARPTRPPLPRLPLIPPPR